MEPVLRKQKENELELGVAGLRKEPASSTTVFNTEACFNPRLV